ncbi:MAG: hypothetical protein ACXVPN_02310 [Bacteroidia bacterium]
MEQKPNIALRILGFIVVLLALTGSIFKIMHWSGAAPFLILVPLLFLFFYLPIWYAQAKNDKEERWFILVQLIFTALFLVYQTFKIFHWPYGNILSNMMYWGSLLILLPLSLYKLFLRGKTSLFKFNNLVLLFYLITFMQTNLMRVAETNVGAGAILLSSQQAEKSYKIITAKSLHLYNAFDQLENKGQNIYYQKAQQLRTYSDSVEKYLHSVKTKIISVVDGRNEAEADTTPISQVMRRTEVSIPMEMLVGDNPDVPKKGKFTGSEIQSVIERYRDSVIKYADKENKSFIASGVNLNTGDTEGEVQDGASRNWIANNFYGMPSISVLITLTNLEYEVKNAETQVLTNLLNNASANATNNLASKIADLSYKLESEKNSREIENLQKDKELTKLKLDAKNQEIADRDSAIFWFSMVILAFIIMIFYIVRSNIARRKINRQLEEQKRDIEQKKELIEEKQKEILDSIHYAKRIQMSQLANEKYIERIFKRLMKP